MFEVALYGIVFFGIVGGLGYWIMRARSAMKSAGLQNPNDESNFGPPSSMS